MKIRKYRQVFRLAILTLKCKFFERDTISLYCRDQNYISSI